MIDLSPQSQDETTAGGTTTPMPRHDAAARDPVRRPHRHWRLSHEQADRAIQFVSRWAGPAVLTATLMLIGWFIIY